MPDAEDLKARLMAELETTIDQLIAQQPPSDEVTLSDMERLVKQAGTAIEAQVMQALAEAHERARGSERPICPECQQPMRNKGKQRRTVVTEAGEIEVERTYYYCDQCRVGIFPPG
jgi:uncharacterized protein with PIN domain